MERSEQIHGDYAQMVDRHSLLDSAHALNGLRKLMGDVQRSDAGVAAEEVVAPHAAARAPQRAQQPSLKSPAPPG